VAPNYVGGKDAATGFKRYYKGKLVDEMYTQLGQLDYAAELSQIRAARPEALYVFLPAAWASISSSSLSRRACRRTSS